MKPIPGVALGQIVGARQNQEDAVVAFRLERGDGAMAMVLADGMGGHAGGEVAAKLATRAMAEHLKSGSAPPASMLRQALLAANAGIRNAAAKSARLEGMGCTVVAAVVTANRLRWISVGDSALLLLREDQIYRLNADHSMRAILNDMVAEGRMSAEDAATDPTRNALRSAVSGEEIELVDAPDTDLALQHGDLVLLVSDGVESLSNDELAATAKRALSLGPERVVSAILKAVAARKVKHQDNASVIAFLYDSARVATGPIKARRTSGPRRRTVVSLMAVALLSVAAWSGWVWVKSHHPVDTVASSAPKPAAHAHQAPLIQLPPAAKPAAPAKPALQKPAAEKPATEPAPVPTANPHH